MSDNYVETRVLVNGHAYRVRIALSPGCPGWEAPRAVEDAARIALAELNNAGAGG